MNDQKQTKYGCIHCGKEVSAVALGDPFSGENLIGSLAIATQPELLEKMNAMPKAAFYCEDMNCKLWGILTVGVTKLYE